MHLKFKKSGKWGEYICLLKQETFKIIPSAVFGVSNILPSSALVIPYKRTADLNGLSQLYASHW